MAIADEPLLVVGAGPTGLAAALELAWLGIEDATILARRIVAGVLESYDAERQRVGRRVIRQTHALTRMVTVRTPLARWPRDRIPPYLLRNAGVQQGLARRDPLTHRAKAASAATARSATSAGAGELLGREIMNRRLGWIAAWLAVITLAHLAPFWTQAAQAQSERPVGMVAALTGEASVLRFGATSPEALATGAALFEGDEVRTADGRARIRLEDGSTLQLGENTSLTLTWVLHAPALQTQSVILSVPSGIVRTIVEALLPRSLFELRTSTAITSVRGTDFIAEASPESTAVVALEGTVAVQSGSRRVGGSVTLGPGEGTDVAAGEPPGEPARWGEARRSDFIARTTLPDR